MLDDDKNCLIRLELTKLLIRYNWKHFDSDHKRRFLSRSNYGQIRTISNTAKDRKTTQQTHTTLFFKFSLLHLNSNIETENSSLSLPFIRPCLWPYIQHQLDHQSSTNKKNQFRSFLIIHLAFQEIGESRAH